MPCSWAVDPTGDEAVEFGTDDAGETPAESGPDPAATPLIWLSLCEWVVRICERSETGCGGDADD